MRFINKHSQDINPQKKKVDYQGITDNKKPEVMKDKISMVEDIINDIVRICRENKDKPRTEVLKLLYELDGIYVPSLERKEVKKLTCKNLNVITTPVLS